MPTNDPALDALLQSITDPGTRPLNQFDPNNRPMFQPQAPDPGTDAFLKAFSPGGGLAPQLPQPPQQLSFPSGRVGAGASGPYSPGALSGAIGALGAEARGLNTSPQNEVLDRSMAHDATAQQERNLGTVGEAYGKQEARVQQDILTLQALQQAQQAAATETRQKMADLTLQAKYANLNKSAFELRQLESIRDTGKATDQYGDQRNATPEERRKAALQLEQGQNIDPRRALKGWRHITAIIGSFLGGVGAAITRTPNYAQEAIQNRIEQDIAAQKAAFDNKRKAIGDEMNMYAMARQSGMDEREAILAANTMSWQAVDVLAKQMGIKNDALGSAARTFQAEADLIRENRSRKIDTLYKQGQLAGEQQRLNISAGAAAGRAGKRSPDQELAMAARQNLQELIGLRRTHESETFPGETKSRMEALSSALTMMLPRVLQRNRGTDADQKLMADLVGNATGWGFKLEKLETALRILDRTLAASGQPTGEEGLTKIGVEGD